MKRVPRNYGFLRPFFLTFLSLFWLQPVAASEMELVSYTDYAPYVSDKVPEGGLVTAIIREALAAEGVTLQINFMPWKRGYRLVQAGEAIGTFSWQKTPKREKEFILSAPLFADANYIFTTLPGFEDFEEIRRRHKAGKKTAICIPLGWTIPERFKEFLAQGVMERIEPEKVQSCIGLMRSGRVHILNIPPLTVHYEIHKAAERLGIQDADLIPGLVTVPPPDSGPSTTHVLFARTSAGEEAAAVFAKGFHTILENGTYKAVLDRHIGLYPGMNRVQTERELRAAGVNFSE